MFSFCLSKYCMYMVAHEFGLRGVRSKVRIPNQTMEGPCELVSDVKNNKERSSE